MDGMGRTPAVVGFPKDGRRRRGGPLSAPLALRELSWDARVACRLALRVTLEWLDTLTSMDEEEGEPVIGIRAVKDDLLRDLRILAFGHSPTSLEGGTREILDRVLRDAVRFCRALRRTGEACELEGLGRSLPPGRDLGPYRRAILQTVLGILFDDPSHMVYPCMIGYYLRDFPDPVPVDPDTPLLKFDAIRVTA